VATGVWLGHADERDVVVIAHRLASALEHGIDALVAVLALGHRCDNPLGQRIGKVAVTAAPLPRLAAGAWDGQNDRHNVQARFQSDG
jgi:hypothetical protein